MTKKSIPDERTVYRFCGNGAGIAGLPHEVTPSEARQRGLEHELQVALERGDYQAIPADEPAEEPKGA